MPGKRVKAEEIVTSCGRRTSSSPAQHGRGAVQAARDHGCDVLPVSEGVLRDEGRPGKASEGARAVVRQAEAAARGRGNGQGDPAGGRPFVKLGVLPSLPRRRAAVEEVRWALPEVSERRLCRVLGQPRPVLRYTERGRDGEGPLTGWIAELASVYGWYGSPRITGTLRNEGWNVNHKRGERVWRHAGLKVPGNSRIVAGCR
jgi:hypothetical protein